MRTWAGLCLVLSLVASAGCGGQRGNQTVNIAADDAAMQAAIMEARRTVPGFLERLPKLTETEMPLVKVRIGKEDGEHIWIDQVTYKDGRIHGKLANKPNSPGYAEGDAVDAAPSEISDWTIIKKDGSSEGGFTIKVMEEKAGRKLQ